MCWAGEPHKLSASYNSAGHGKCFPASRGRKPLGLRTSRGRVKKPSQSEEADAADSMDQDETG